MGDPGCCFENVCKAGGSGRQSRPSPSPADFPSPNARFFLRWHRIWQKLSEAGTWYSFSVPPPFYAFLIFKAIIGLSDKILSNQILSSSLVLWLPFGWKSCGVADVGRALPEPGLAEGTVCLNKVYANMGAAEVPIFPPTPARCTPVHHASRTLMVVNIGVQVTQAVTVTDPLKMGRGGVPGPDPAVWAGGCVLLFADGKGKLPGHFLKGGVERRDEP